MSRFLPVAAALFIVSVAMSDSEAHEAAVVPVDNADGVIFELCKQLTYATVDEEAERQAFYDVCIKWAVQEIHALPYAHDHS
jgi:hypothetical protein